jgi:hypothetical protein
MRVKTGIAVGMLAALLGAACATWHSDWEKACGPQVDPTLKPCSCFDARTPSCPPVPTDTKKPDGGSR